MVKTHNTTRSVQNTEISFGDKVYVRNFAGELLERYVWNASGDNVFVCTKRVFELLNNDGHAPMPIGFPYSDVLTMR